MNRLASEKSPYLRHAAHQPVDWHPWSDDAFALAEREDKPVFLSTGAVWCHWCHVMAGECFENEEIARLMNELFVNIKLDRDERPDIDRRYQQAVAAMGGGSGWPLSVFLTPDRQPFLGGTYFPPEDMLGRPGFKKVLQSVSEYYLTKKEDVATYAARVMEVLQPEALQPGDLAFGHLDEAAVAMISQHDSRHGGFGDKPKFPMPGALEFLIRRSTAQGDAEAGGVVRRTLDAMAQGGFHDHLAGGFHRYSVDEAWLVPHFEKMADDNAWLLRNYLDGYAVFGDERYRRVAEGIIAFARETLSDPAGGFYASQDADVTAADEGGYFTWTDEDFQRVLDADEYEALSRRFLDARGALHHDPAKRVLFAVMEPAEIATRIGKPEQAVREAIARGNEKLLAERSRREPPFVDSTLYTAINGMFIASFFRAYRVLRDEALKDFALASLQRLLRDRLDGATLLHVEGVPALLDDHVHLIEALVEAYEATAVRSYLEQADQRMQVCLELFYDQEQGGFFDTEAEVLGTRFKRIEDIPHPSANAVAVMQMLKLHLLTGTRRYATAAEATLKLFAETAKGMGIHAGAYYAALHASYGMVKLTVEAAPASGLAAAARAAACGIPAVLEYGEDHGRIIPCMGTTCYEPVSDPAALVARVRELARTRPAP